MLSSVSAEDAREDALAAAIRQIAANRVLLEGPSPRVGDADAPAARRRAGGAHPYTPADGARKREQRARDPEAGARHRARKAVHHAVAAGRLVPGACRECGARPTEAHHYDHAQPLAVVWLCKVHHDALTHAARRRGLAPPSKRRGW